MEVERHVDQALAAAAVASHTGAPTAGLWLQQVQSVTTLMVPQKNKKKNQLEGKAFCQGKAMKALPCPKPLQFAGRT